MRREDAADVVANAAAVALLPALLVVGGAAWAVAAVKRRLRSWPWPSKPVRIDELACLPNEDIDFLLSRETRRS